jgi:Zn-dependent protease
MGIAATLLFFLTLLAHELSHSLVARTKGIPVEGITLFIFGGVARTRLDAESPGDEFQIAGIGPLTSLVIAALFGLLGWLGRQVGWSIPVTGVFDYLAYANLVIAIFNLLPGFPLDGGRVFRSIIWKFTGSLKKATRIASIGGQLLGYFLVFVGFLQMLQTNILGGLWLVLIGWFLSTAAEASYQQQLIQMGLEGVRA